MEHVHFLELWLSSDNWGIRSDLVSCVCNSVKAIILLSLGSQRQNYECMQALLNIDLNCLHIHY